MSPAGQAYPIPRCFTGMATGLGSPVNRPRVSPTYSPASASRGSTNRSANPSPVKSARVAPSIFCGTRANKGAAAIFPAPRFQNTRLLPGKINSEKPLRSRSYIISGIAAICFCPGCASWRGSIRAMASKTGDPARSSTTRSETESDPATKWPCESFRSAHFTVNLPRTIQRLAGLSLSACHTKLKSDSAPAFVSRKAPICHSDCISRTSAFFTAAIRSRNWEGVNDCATPSCFTERIPQSCSVTPSPDAGSVSLSKTNVSKGPHSPRWLRRSSASFTKVSS